MSPITAPRLIPTAYFAPAERSAMRLDGQLADLAGIEGVPGPPTLPRDRVAFLAEELPEVMVAERSTVLWLHGLLSELPCPLPVCVDIRHRYVEQAPPGVQIRQVVIDADQIDLLDGLRRTGPARTVLDLIRSPGEPDWKPLRAYVALTGVARDEVSRQIDRRAHLPHKKRARLRLDALYAPISPP
jgi:hypothetical protein